MIENPVEYQKLLWNISEEGKETLWAYSSEHTEVLLATYFFLKKLLLTLFKQKLHYISRLKKKKEVLSK